MNLLLVDLDGTVREWTKSDDSPVVLLPGARDAIAAFHANGWSVVGISNQKGVMDGYKTLKGTCQQIRKTMQATRFIERTYLCPDEGSSCWMVSNSLLWTPARCVDRTGEGYRKPAPGMLLKALNWHWERWYPHLTDSLVTGFTLEDALEVGLFRFLFVGDRPEDVGAAAAANIPYVDAEKWRNQGIAVL